MNQLLDLYLFCGGFGFIWITGTALIGFTNAGNDAGGGDGSDASGGGDSGDLGSADGSSGGDLGGADSSGADGGSDLGNIETNTVGTFRTGLVIRKKRLSPMLLTLKILSPSTLTTFMFFFGLCGYLLLHSLPAIGPWSLLPATVLGVIGYNAFSAFSSMLIKRMHVSGGFRQNDCIGIVGEVSVPISPGRVGEVTYSIHGSRQTASAKGIDPSSSFSTGSKVMLAQERQGLFLVETANLDATWDEGGTSAGKEPVKKVEKQ